MGVVVSVSGDGWVGSAWWMNKVCSWLWGGELMNREVKTGE